MAPVLVTVEQVAAWLGEPLPATPGTGATDIHVLLSGLLEDVEGLLVTDCGRQHRPFAAAQTTRVEVQDGTGTDTLWLDYPLAVFTSLVVGEDPGDPDETLTAADLAIGVGSRRLVRRGGGRFGVRGAPRVVQVTYNAQADLPRVARLAVLDVAAQFWRRRGSEETLKYREGAYSADLAEVKKSSTAWESAVSSLMEV